MLEIKDSVAVITGGGSGIGLTVAHYWVRNGGHVVLGDIAAEALVQAEKEIKALNGGVSQSSATQPMKMTVPNWPIPPSKTSAKSIWWPLLPESSWTG